MGGRAPDGMLKPHITLERGIWYCDDGMYWAQSRTSPVDAFTQWREDWREFTARMSAANTKRKPPG